MGVAGGSKRWIFGSQLRFCADIGWHGRMFVGMTGQVAPINLAAFRAATLRCCEAKG
jgi:hypothetical protein